MITNNWSPSIPRCTDRVGTGQPFLDQRAIASPIEERGPFQTRLKPATPPDDNSFAWVLVSGRALEVESPIEDIPQLEQ